MLPSLTPARCETPEPGLLCRKKDKKDKKDKKKKDSSLAQRVHVGICYIPRGSHIPTLSMDPLGGVEIMGFRVSETILKLQRIQVSYEL